MQYAFLIYTNEESEPKPGSDEQKTIMDGYRKFTEEVTSNAVMITGEPLESVSTATTIRLRDGKTLMTDGPFAETKEQLGGFYILECKNIEEAIVYAAKIHSAAYGSIEIRPVMSFG